MKQSLVPGKLLPESHDDFLKLPFKPGIYRTECITCGCRFSDENTHSPEGWRDTQIVGFCEDCLDEAMGPDEEN